MLGRDGMVASYIPALARVQVAQFSLALCVGSPMLDATGNSLLGTKALELFVGMTGPRQAYRFGAV